MITQNDIQNYIDELKHASDNRFAKSFPKSKPSVFSFTIGSKYARVINTTQGGQGRTVTCHCFINMQNGDLLKPAGWKAPAPGVRGNIFNESKPYHTEEFYYN